MTYGGQLSLTYGGCNMEMVRIKQKVITKILERITEMTDDIMQLVQRTQFTPFISMVMEASQKTSYSSVTGRMVL